MGRGGLRVSELCLGTMTFGEEWGWGSDRKESKKVFDAYANAGGNFIDTANRYTEGTSERLVGEFMGKERDHFVLATKYTLYMDKRDVNSCGNHRKNMIQSLNASLKRLNTDYIDLFWLHAWDFTTRIDEVMRGLDDLVSSGKILYIGISNTPAWVISRANTLADLRGLTPFVSLQIEYNLVERTPERDLLPMARSMDIGVCPWGVLAAGVLTGKYNKGSKGEPGLRLEGRPIDKGKLKISEEVVKIAKEIGCKPGHVAISWLSRQPGIVSPIIGARTVGQLKDNIASLKCKLDDDHIKRLNKISAIDLGYPHDFLRKDVVRDLIYGPFEIDQEKLRS